MKLPNMLLCILGTPMLIAMPTQSPAASANVNMDPIELETGWYDKASVDKICGSGKLNPRRRLCKWVSVALAALACKMIDKTTFDKMQLESGCFEAKSFSKTVTESDDIKRLDIINHSLALRFLTLLSDGDYAASKQCQQVAPLAECAHLIAKSKLTQTYDYKKCYDPKNCVRGDVGELRPPGRECIQDEKVREDGIPKAAFLVPDNGKTIMLAQLMPQCFCDVSKYYVDPSNKCVLRGKAQPAPAPGATTGLDVLAGAVGATAGAAEGAPAVAAPVTAAGIPLLKAPGKTVVSGTTGATAWAAAIGGTTDAAGVSPAKTATVA